MKVIKKLTRIFAVFTVVILLAGTVAFPVRAAEESFVAGDIVSETVAAEGGPVSRELAEFQFLTGDFFGGGQLAPFTVFSGPGTYDPADVVGDAGGDNFAMRWQWRATAENATVLKITAKEDICFEVSQSDPNAEQWAVHSAYTYVTENPEGDRLIYREVRVQASMDGEYIHTVVHLAKGDTLYIVYAIVTGEGGNATADYWPNFTMSTEGYDAAQRADYSALAELNKAISEKSEALQTAYKDMIGDGSVYSDTNASSLEDIVNDTLAEMAKMSAAEDVENAYNAALEKMGEVRTLADEAAVLEAFKKTTREELNGLASEEDYSARNWKTIQEYIQQAGAEIDAAENSAKVSQVAAAAKVNILAVEKGGDGLPIAIAIAIVIVIVVVIVAVLAAVVAKKKGKSKE